MRVSLNLGPESRGIHEDPHLSVNHHIGEKNLPHSSASKNYLIASIISYQREGINEY
jgi:hypothetical protein